MDIPVKLERERRWLLCQSTKGAPAVLESLANLLSGCEKSEIKQWYISTKPVLRIRSYDDSKFIFCVKTRGDGNGIGVPESEAELNREEFENLFRFVLKNPIKKTRYSIPLENGLIAELDVFREPLFGLVIIEVEFDSDEAAESFVPPSWFGNTEITGNEGFSNSTLYSLMGEDGHDNEKAMIALIEPINAKIKEVLKDNYGHSPDVVKVYLNDSTIRNMPPVGFKHSELSTMWKDYRSDFKLSVTQHMTDYYFVKYKIKGIENNIRLNTSQELIDFVATTIRDFYKGKPK